MRRAKVLGLSLAAVVVWGLVVGVSPVGAQTKEAQGTVSAVTDSSITVKVGQQDMAFVVDSTTRLEDRSAARATRDAQTAGGPGIKLTQFIKAGQPVIVGYKEAGGKNHAEWVRPASTATPGAPGETGKSASGKVKAVTAGLLTITSEGKDMAFAIDSGTNVEARGAGTAAKAAGGRLAITELVGVGDTVTVSYKGAGTAMTATDIRITAKNR